MKLLVDRAILNPGFRAYAIRVASQHGRNGITQAYGIRQWLTERVSFIRDPDQLELLQSPVEVLTQIVQVGQMAMDCDDVAMLGAALGRAVGLRARFVVTAFQGPQKPFAHVWTELSDNRQQEWVELDITRTAQALNIPVTRRMVVPA